MTKSLGPLNILYLLRLSMSVTYKCMAHSNLKLNWFWFKKHLVLVSKTNGRQLKSFQTPVLLMVGKVCFFFVVTSEPSIQITGTVSTNLSFTCGVKKRH
jgi:hypothetical protein